MNDFNIQKQALIKLAKSAITGEMEQIPHGADFNEVYKFAQSANIAPLIYAGIKKSKTDVDDEVLQQFKMASLRCLLYCENQRSQLGKVYDVFEREGIDYLPMKGSVVSFLYPDAYMRVMGDVDILVRKEQFEQAKKLFSDMGFEKTATHENETSFVKGALYVELHTLFCAPVIGEFYDYYRQAWSFAKINEDGKHRYSMTNEDFYVYQVVHFAKHFITGGIGLKHFIDFYVMKLKLDELDYDYIKSQLKIMKLDKFFDVLRDTLDVLFYGAPWTEGSASMAETLFKSGVFGTGKDNGAFLAVNNEQNGKGTSAFSTIKTVVFMPYKRMCLKYPVLKKAPVLLPAFWILRIFSVMFSRGNGVNPFKYLLGIKKGMNKASISEYKQKMMSVGLDFYSTEE